MNARIERTNGDRHTVPFDGSTNILERCSEDVGEVRADGNPVVGLLNERRLLEGLDTQRNRRQK